MSVQHYYDHDWRKPSLIYTPEWRAAAKKAKLSTEEKLANILSRYFHANVEYKQCDHCTDIAKKILPEIKELLIEGAVL